MKLVVVGKATEKAGLHEAGAHNQLRMQPLRSLQVPQCYLHSPPRLQPGYFQKFQPDTLFYIFYGMPGDEAQLFAAEELGSR